MIYKVEFSAWKDSLEVGDTVREKGGKQIKVLSVIKIESFEHDIEVVVLGVDTCDIE